MERTTSGSETVPGSVFEGWNIGAVSVKPVRLHEHGFPCFDPLLGRRSRPGWEKQDKQLQKRRLDV